jgi:hypothetical protein
MTTTPILSHSADQTEGERRQDAALTLLAIYRNIIVCWLRPDLPDGDRGPQQRDLSDELNQRGEPTAATVGSLLET